jgi:hypothetical protein
MSEIVFVLGAGASKMAGAPLMANFLDVADDLRKQNLAKEVLEDFDLVFKARAELQKAHSKAQLDIMNLESVFAAFEMAKLLERLGPLTPEEISRLSKAMRTLIVTTLELSINLPVRDRRVRPPSPYESFSGLIRVLVKARRTVSVITLNYDLCLDYALSSLGLPVSYCLGGEGDERGTKFLKLHGSMNFAQCSSCNKVVAWKLPDYFRQVGRHPWGDETSVRLKVASNMKHFMHCGGSSVEGAFIVPPTWNKAQHHEQLGVVWRAAANELKDAKDVYIIGFSLPPTDFFFRQFYALASIGPTLLRRFWVFDPDESVESRFRDLLGPQAMSRFEFFPKRFDEAIDPITQATKPNTS